MSACAHDKAWISSQQTSGGCIGYSAPAFYEDRETVVKDFNKAANKICGSSRWVIVREIIPPPTSTVSAIRNASKGDVKGTVDSGSQVFMHDVLYRSKRMDKDVKVEYGSPFNSWNEAEIKCSAK